MKKLTAITLFSLTLLPAFAQRGKGKVTGYVYDSKTGKGIAGAVVVLAKDEYYTGSARTGTNGRYTIEILHADTYDIKIQYPAYQAQLIHGVVVEQDKATLENFFLNPEEAPGRSFPARTENKPAVRQTKTKSSETGSVLSAGIGKRQ